MDKKTFIAELEHSLSVLQEDELKDIISEYEQHIDLKVLSGLSEEEAIADFGSVPELTAEILEAYHVRVDYAAQQERTKKEKARKDRSAALAEGEQAGREILKKTGGVCRQAGNAAAKGMKRIWPWLVGVLAFWKGQVKRPFAWAAAKWREFRESRENRGGAETATEAVMEMAADGKAAGVMAPAARQGERHVRAAGPGVRRGVVPAAVGLTCRFFRFCGRLILWCVRAAWNVCWAFAAFFCVCFGLFALFGLGVLVVLLLQGYPLAGATLGCFGLNLCLFGAAGLCLTFLWRKERGGSRPAGQSAGNFQGMEGEQHA